MIPWIKALVLPPAGFFLLAALGLPLRRRWPKVARGLWIATLASAYLLSTPFVGSMLLRSLESEPPLDPGQSLPELGAIVILGGDHAPHAPEMPGGEGIGSLTLERLRHGAQWARRSGLPILVTGGIPRNSHRSTAALMAATLGEWGLEARWIEERAWNTAENARFSREMLGDEGIDSILLVSQSWHLPRARRAFEAQGFEVLCAPTAFEPPPEWDLRGWIPSANGLRESTFGLHEWLGRAWYRLRGAPR